MHQNSFNVREELKKKKGSLAKHNKNKMGVITDTNLLRAIMAPVGLLLPS